MTTEELDKLKELAERATPGAVSPDVVLRLIAEIERLQALILIKERDALRAQLAEATNLISRFEEEIDCCGGEYARSYLKKYNLP